MSSHAPSRSPELLPLGPDGVLVRFSRVLDDASNRAVLAFRAAVEEAGIDGITETATALASALLRFDRTRTSRRSVVAAAGELLSTRDWYAAPLPTARRRWTIPAAFGGKAGPQLDDVAQLAGLSPEAAVSELTGRDVRVLALGFAPGQPYMGILPDHWDIPRQRELTMNAPGGAVIVAVRQIVLLSGPTPTGWRQAGRSAFRCFQPGAEAPFPLRAGDEVRFRAIGEDELAALEAATDPLGGATVEALS
jgi:KipI family sensor histidine kinase inhibitor